MQRIFEIINIGKGVITIMTPDNLLLINEMPNASNTLVRVSKGYQTIADVATLNTSDEDEKGDIFKCHPNASTIWLAAIWKGNDIEDIENDFIPIAVYTIDEENQQ